MFGERLCSSPLTEAPLHSPAAPPSLDAAAHGGQVACELALVERVISEWTQRRNSPPSDPPWDHEGPGGEGASVCSVPPRPNSDQRAWDSSAFAANGGASVVSQGRLSSSRSSAVLVDGCVVPPSVPPAAESRASAFLQPFPEGDEGEAFPATKGGEGETLPTILCDRMPAGRDEDPAFCPTSTTDVTGPKPAGGHPSSFIINAEQHHSSSGACPQQVQSQEDTHTTKCHSNERLDPGCNPSEGPMVDVVCFHLGSFRYVQLC